VNPLKYDSIFSGLSTLVKEQGPMSLWRGWTGKFFGYGFQGGCRFGFYEYFEKKYSDVFIGQKNRSAVYFVSSESAQVFADVALCPFESVKFVFKHSRRLQKG
jgi:solute carrier family 25 (mitochondrial phosphate transporter), member 3